MLKGAVKYLLVCGTILAMATTAWAAKPAARSKKTTAAKPRKSVWQLTASAYAFHDVTFAETIDKTKDLALKYIEGFSWQKISPKHPEEFNGKAPAEALEAMQKKLKGDGLDLISYYVHDRDWGDEANARKHFEFCKKMGVKIIVSEPKAELLEMIDTLAKEYKVKVALHNHPKKDSDPSYTNWDPENVMKLLKGRSTWIGTCADTGHWARSGLDPVACLKKYEGRLLEVHVKDIDEKRPEGKDVVWGTGVANVKGQLAELNRQRFSGPIVIEYESNLGKNIPDQRQCIEFYDKVVKELGRSSE